MSAYVLWMDAAWTCRNGDLGNKPNVVIGRACGAGDLEPSRSADERHAFEAGAATLREAARGVLTGGGVA